MTPDPTTDPAGYVLAVADQREQRATAAPFGPYRTLHNTDDQSFVQDHRGLLDVEIYVDNGRAADLPATRNMAEHIAAEANPDHALKEVALWRSIAERHQIPRRYRKTTALCAACTQPAPCPDLLNVVAAAKAYDQTKELD